MGNSENLPLLNVTLGDARVVQSILGIPSEISDDGHCTNSNNTLEGQIGLVTAWNNQY